MPAATSTGRKARYVHPETRAALISIQDIVEDTQHSWALTEHASNVAVDSTLANASRILQGGIDAYRPIAKAQARADRKLRGKLGAHAHEVIRAVVAWRVAGDITAEQVRPPLPAELTDYTVDGLTAAEYIDRVVVGFQTWVTDFDVEFLGCGIDVANLTLGIAGTIDLVARLRTEGYNALIEITTGAHIGQASEQLAGLRTCHTALGDAVLPSTRRSLVLQLRPEYPDGYAATPIDKTEQARTRRSFRRALARYLDLRAAPALPGRPLVAPGKTPALVLLAHQGYGEVPTILAREAKVATLGEIAALGAEGCAALNDIGPARMLVVERMLQDYGLAFAA